MSKIRCMLVLVSLIAMIMSKTPKKVGEIEVLEPGDVIDKFSTEEMPDNFYTDSIKYLSGILDRYVFLDIFKNPPQPTGYDDYHRSGDLQEKIKNINLTDINFYKFYREVKSILNIPRDGHFNIRFGNSSSHTYRLDQLYYYHPLVLTIDENKNVYGSLSDYIDEETLREIYNDTIIDTIKNLTDIPIKSIKDLEPIDYIQNFREDFNDFHNAHARFTYNLNSINKGRLAAYPLTLEEFTNLTVVYNDEDNTTISFDFKILEESNYINYIANRYGVNSDDLTTELEKLEKKYAKSDIFDAVNLYKKINNLDESDKLEEKNEELTWDYQIDNGAFKCRKDDTNKVNVYYQNIFMVNDMDEYYKYVLNCSLLFEENEYPIVVIEDQNGGGSEEVTSSFQEILQPRLEIMSYNSFRDSDVVKENLNMEMEEGKVFSQRYFDLEKCNAFENADAVFKKTATDNFGEGATHTRSYESILTVGYEFRKKVDAIKNKITHRRKPTEIIVFTDSFAFSATCFFIKSMQEFGGAIIVGYNGNPNMEKKTFDASQSPAGYLDDQIHDDNWKGLVNLGYDIHSITTFESFSSYVQNKSLGYNVPRELEIDPIDERVDIYSKYSDSLYDTFMEKANEIFEKYKQQCNPNNLRLHLDSTDCDGKMSNKYTHGGYVCGSDGNWTDTCKPYYCDSGYYFNSYQGICVKNPCASQSNGSFIQFNLLKFAIIALILSLFL